MYIVCKRTRKRFFLMPHEINFLTLLVNRMDLDKTFEEFWVYESDYIQCQRLGTLIQDHIEENKIFESLESGQPIPILVDDNINKPNACQPLSLERLAFLSEFVTFLSNSRFGVRVETKKN